jgi:hypothetical protein
MATPGKVGRVLIQKPDFTPVAFTDEATTADATKTRFSITDDTKCYWDRNTPVTVEVDSSPVATGFHIEYPGGVIVFDEEQTGAVTVSGKYIEVEQLAGFFNWSLTVDNKTIDITCFESGEWADFLLATKSWNASADKFWASDADFTQRLGQEVIVALYADFGTAKTRFEGYACMNSDAVDVTVNDVIKDKISFQGTEGIYFRQG